MRLEIPIAVGFGFFLKRFPKHFWLITFIAITLMVFAVIIGHFIPIQIPPFFSIPSTGLWTIILLVYAFIAATLPVQTLLQPRDFLNAWQLLFAFA